MGVSPICHTYTCPTDSITLKDFTRFQIVLWNPSMGLEINYAFTRSWINCIVIFTYSIVNYRWHYNTVCHRWHSKDGSVWQTHCTRPILSSNSFPCIISLHVFCATVLVALLLLLFRVDALRYIGCDWTHIFRRKCDPPQSIHGNTLYIIPLDLQFRHVQLHVTCHVNILHTHFHQWPLYKMNDCQNHVIMDAMVGNQLWK